MARAKAIQNMTVQEASDFWDNHTFDEFEDVTEVADMRFRLTRKKYVGIEEKLYALIKKEAKKRRQSEEALVQEWLLEKAEALRLQAA